MADHPLQTWELTVDDRAHRVEVSGSVRHRVTWWVDGRLVAEERSAEETVRVAAPAEQDLGVLAVRFSGLGKPRRATLHDGAATAATGLGGIDLDPEQDSPAAAYEERVRAHPRRYAALETAVGVGKVLGGILVAVLLARLAFSVPLPDWDLPSPDVPWPDLPSPDLPSVPWPDLPAIPWPDWTLPGWLAWVLEHATYVVPVLVAFGLAQAEIRRRRAQDALREERRDD